MTNATGPLDDAGTELSPEELEGLIPSYITLRSELNAAELRNIAEAARWTERSSHKEVLNESFLRKLHERMFGNVWKWAGTYRATGKNIGVDAYRIGTEINQLIDDVMFQIENQSFEPDEIVARFHHRLVQIHCYPNGNGRHARVATDLLLKQLDRAAFSWGRTSLIDPKEVRTRYIAALQAADKHDYSPLLKFVRS